MRARERMHIFIPLLDFLSNPLVLLTEWERNTNKNMYKQGKENKTDVSHFVLFHTLFKAAVCPRRLQLSRPMYF